MDVVVTFDADGQHDAGVIPQVIRLLDDGNVCVVGSRRAPARLAERLFAVYTRAAYGIRDPLCGLKGYRMSVYSELGHFDSYHSFGTELMLFCLRTGYPVAQIAVTVGRRRGKPRLGGSIRANWGIARSLAGAWLRAKRFSVSVRR